MLTGFCEKTIIADTTCFIAFDNIGRFDILQAVCPSIITTPEVAFEYNNPLPQWIQVISVEDTSKIKSISTILGAGEASAIALALETVNPLVILDDKKARRYAKNLGLDFTGIVGLLRRGYKQGFVSDMDSVIASLHAIGFRLPENTIELIKK